MMIRLSVIIPTRNRCGSLAATLASIEGQTLDRSLFEVIVCDNNSTDDTAAVARGFDGKFPHFRYVRTEEPGLHVGRNKGCELARGALLVYADDDIEAFPSWLEAIVGNFDDARVALAGGKVLPRFEVPPPDWIRKMWEPNRQGERLLGYLSLIDLGDTRKETSACHVFGCNFAVRRDIILACRGFHPDAMPRDLIRLRGDGESHVSRYVTDHGHTTIYDPLAGVHHSVPAGRMTPDYFRQRAFDQGISDAYALTRYGENRPAHSGWRERLRTSLFKMARDLRCRIFDGDLYQRTRLFDKAYQDGLRYHQDEVRRDEGLRQWVMRESY